MPEKLFTVAEARNAAVVLFYRTTSIRSCIVGHEKNVDNSNFNQLKMSWCECVLLWYN